MKQKRIHLSPGFYLMMATSLLVVPVRWIIAWMIAAAVHELCHILALKLSGSKIYLIKLGFCGAKIEVQLTPGIKSAFCALAGPMGGLLLLCVYRIAPRTALCALSQSLFNLLPIYPMDGGRVLEGLICAVAGEGKTRRFISAVERITRVLLLLISIYVSVIWHLGLLPAIICILLFLRSKNIPCKPSPYRVQYV